MHFTPSTGIIFFYLYQSFSGLVVACRFFNFFKKDNNYFRICTLKVYEAIFDSLQN